MDRISEEKHMGQTEGMLPPTLDSIRNAWAHLGKELSPQSQTVTIELEEYLRAALFQMSAIAHKLKTDRRSWNGDDLRSAGSQLEKCLLVCEQISLFVLYESQAIHP